MIACCLINVCIGSVNAWSVFAGPMAAHLGQVTGTELTIGNLIIVFTVANSIGPITMISGGKINDMFGPRNVLFIGGILFGGGMIISGFVKSVPMLIFSYGIISGLGIGLAYGCTISTAVKFFPDKRGLTGGIATAMYGLSSVLVPPIANILISSKNVVFAFRTFGISFLIIVCGSSLFIEKCPDDFVPAGWIPKGNIHQREQLVNKNWKEMLKEPVFYVMIALLMCGAFYGLMCISQASSLAQRIVGMSAFAAGTAVSVLALFNAFGRIAAGSISDKIGRINTLTLACILAIIGLGCLYFSAEGTVALFYTGISLVGVCFGSFMGVFPGFTADQFGSYNNSVNYGIMFIGFALAGYFGPTIMGAFYQTDGSYSKAFIAAIGLAVAGICLSVVYRILEKRMKEEPK